MHVRRPTVRCDASSAAVPLDTRPQEDPVLLHPFHDKSCTARPDPAHPHPPTPAARRSAALLGRRPSTCARPQQELQLQRRSTAPWPSSAKPMPIISTFFTASEHVVTAARCAQSSFRISFRQPALPGARVLLCAPLCSGAVSSCRIVFLNFCGLKNLPFPSSRGEQASLQLVSPRYSLRLRRGL